MSIDLLSTVLRDTGFSGRQPDLTELVDGAVFRFPCARSMGLHLVLHGTVYLHSSELEAPVCLKTGDIAVMARGYDHALSTRETLEGSEVDHLRLPSGGAPAAATVLGGAYLFWHAPLHPFFAEMPAWTVLSASEISRLDPVVLASTLLANEMRASNAPGAVIAMQGLLDVVFAFALRHVIAGCAEAQVGWSQAQADPQIGRVVALMHEDPAYSWSLNELARRAGLSRTGLAERFRETMGDTPLSHLRTLRMQRAMKLLTETSQPLETVATAVGYRDAFSFSKVFKRTLGHSPKTFRQLDALEREGL